MAGISLSGPKLEGRRYGFRFRILLFGPLQRCTTWQDCNGQSGLVLLRQLLSCIRRERGMAINWDAIFEQWPWFAAAAGVLVVVIGLLILLRPKSKRQPITADSAVDSKEWVLTGRIDFVDPHSAGELVLQVEETRIVNSPSGVEHREIRWRRATLDEGKMVLVSYHAQRNLLMSANFIVSAPPRTKQSANGALGGGGGSHTHWSIEIAVKPNRHQRA